MTYLKTLCVIGLLGLSPVLSAATLAAGVGSDLPPYVIIEQDRGLELDIVRETMKLAGYDIEPVYLPFARVVSHLAQRQVDLALTINESVGIEGVYFSDSHIAYRNVVVTLSEHHYMIESIDDLSQYAVLAFQNATLYLGNEYEQMASANPAYSEHAQQELQIRQLFKGRVDAVVLDINIFHYLRGIESTYDVSADFTVHEIFPSVEYKVGFVDPLVRDSFNAALKQLKISGAYEAIFKRYQLEPAKSVLLILRS